MDRLGDAWIQAWREVETQEGIIEDLEAELVDLESPIGGPEDKPAPEVRPPGLRLVTGSESPRSRLRPQSAE